MLEESRYKQQKKNWTQKRKKKTGRSEWETNGMMSIMDEKIIQRCKRL